MFNEIFFGHVWHENILFIDISVEKSKTIEIDLKHACIFIQRIFNSNIFLAKYTICTSFDCKIKKIFTHFPKFLKFNFKTLFNNK